MPFIYARVAPGYSRPAPLVLTFHDDGGSTFVNAPLTISGEPGYALAALIPSTTGLHTITVAATGGGGIGPLVIPPTPAMTSPFTFSTDMALYVVA